MRSLLALILFSGCAGGDPAGNADAGDLVDAARDASGGACHPTEQFCDLKGYSVDFKISDLQPEPDMAGDLWMCAPLLATCSKNTDCCVLTCEPFADGGSRCCIVGGGPCTSSEQCCAGLNGSPGECFMGKCYTA